MAPIANLRHVISVRLNAAAEEICEIFAKTFAAYEQEIVRQRKLLEHIPAAENKIKSDDPQPSTCNDLFGRQLYDQKRSSGVGHEDHNPSGIKEEHDETYPIHVTGTVALQQEPNASQENDQNKVPNQLLYTGQPETEGNRDPQHIMPIIMVKSELERERSGVADRDQLLSYDVAARQSRDNNGITSTGPNVEHTSLKCHLCNQEFDEYTCLLHHERAHSAKDPCKCGSLGETSNQTSLKVHTEGKPSSCTDAHTDDKVHICVTCGKSFTRSANLKRHTRAHTGEKPYNCDYCGRDFSHHSSLRNHRRLHTGEKPYKCAWCGKQFAIRTTLKIHTRIHTGEKPYKCPICGKAFAHKSAMRDHTGTHKLAKSKS